MRKKVILLVVITFFAFIAEYKFNLSSKLTLSTLKANKEYLLDLYSQKPLEFITTYFILYLIVTAVSLPGAGILSLAGGAIFGLFYGVIIVSFASTIGATLALLLTRYVFRDFARSSFHDSIQKIDAGIRRDGSFYLFALRLVPAFPFFLINLGMALTSISAKTFFWISQLGMLPGTIAFIFAGTQLAEVESLSDVLSFRLLLAFTILGLLPLAMRSILNYLKLVKISRKYSKPANYDYNLIVIGAGSAGLVSSYIAAALKAKVLLIEQNKMGGDCLNTGCVPSKSLIRSTHVLSLFSRASEFGIRNTNVNFSFGDIMEKVRDSISRVEPHDSKDRYERLGVKCLSGEAKIIDPYRVKVGDQTFTTKNIIIATGAIPKVPRVMGIDKVPYYTSDTIWQIPELPKKLLVVGGGPIGCELGQCFARLGSIVTIVEKHDQLLRKEEIDAASFLEGRLQSERISILKNHSLSELCKDRERYSAILKNKTSTLKIPFDAVLIAIGREARTTGFGLEELGISTNSQSGTIATDDYLNVGIPNMFACGDVAGPFQFTHFAAYQAWFATMNVLFRPFKKFKVNYRVIPRCTFTEPEVAAVGLTESEATANSIPYEVSKFELAELDRAITDRENYGFISVLTKPEKDKILGVTIVGYRASEMLAEFVLAMNNNIGLKKILESTHIYPTMSEGNKYVAGAWRKQHAPKWALKLLERFHKWRISS